MRQGQVKGNFYKKKIIYLKNFKPSTYILSKQSVSDQQKITLSMHVRSLILEFIDCKLISTSK